MIINKSNISNMPIGAVENGSLIIARSRGNKTTKSQNTGLITFVDQHIR